MTLRTSTKFLLAVALVGGAFVAGELGRKQFISRDLPVSPPVVASTQATPTSKFEMNFTEAEETRVGDFVIRLRTRTVKNTCERGDRTTFTFVTVERAGQVLLTLDDASTHDECYGSTAKYAVASLAPGKKHLVVSQETYRHAAMVIATLDEAPRLIFKSGDFDVSEAGFIDLNRDGRMEIRAVSRRYQYFHGLSNMNSPIPIVIFQYDPATAAYRPANSRFPELVLLDADALKQCKLDLSGNPGLPGLVFEIAIGYAYTGRDADAWAFFDQWFPGDAKEKAEARSALKKALAADPVYRAVSTPK
jgi:hypothetical protein